MRTEARLFAFATLLAVACGDPSSPETDFTGNYTLQSVNGHALPYVVAQTGPNTVAITEDHLVIADGGSWSEITTYRVTDTNGTRDETDSNTGTWLRTGSTLTLASDYVATISRNTLTFNDGTFVQVFVK